MGRRGHSQKCCATNTRESTGKPPTGSRHVPKLYARMRVRADCMEDKGHRLAAQQAGKVQIMWKERWEQLRQIDQEITQERGVKAATQLLEAAS